MVSLTEDLLTLSGVGRRQMDRQEVDLGRIAAEIGARLDAESTGPAVTLRVAPGLVAFADAGLARIALENLLGNAWKYSARSAAPCVEFFAEDAGGERVFVVRDNGAGFDATLAHRLFQPFQRLHSSRDYPGTGVGLVTVARVVRRHGGRVWAEGAPGHGASFRFTLPAAADADGPG
jgi:signal transduction histidine kinase